MLSRFFLFLDNSGISLYFSVKIGRIIPLKSPSASIPSKICDDTKKFDEFVNVNKTVLTAKKISISKLSWGNQDFPVSIGDSNEAKIRVAEYSTILFQQGQPRFTFK